MDEIEGRLIRMQEARDHIYSSTLEVIRICGKSITHVHAGKIREAELLLREAKKKLDLLGKTEKGNEYYTLQAHQEYVEAYIVYNIVVKGKVPAQREMGESDAAYLLGMLDVVGELKREAFECLRKADVEKAREYYEIMAEIYDSTRHMRFSDSITPDLRKKQDMARIQMESTSTELLRFAGR
jgi:translin